MKLNKINICVSVIFAIFCSVRSDFGIKDETKPVTQLVGNYNPILSFIDDDLNAASVQQRKSFRLLKVSLRGLGMSIRIFGDTIGGSIEHSLMRFAIVNRFLILQEF